MTAPAHLAVGAAICSRVRRPWLGLALAFGAHFLLDAIPHFEQAHLVGEAIGLPGRYVWAAFGATTFGALTLVVLLLARRFRARPAHPRLRYLIAGGLLSDLPDCLKYLGGAESWFGRFHSAFHAQPYWGTALYRLFAEPPVPATRPIPDEVLIHSPWAWAGWLLMIAFELAVTIIAAAVALTPPSGRSRRA